MVSWTAGLRTKHRIQSTSHSGQLKHPYSPSCRCGMGESDSASRASVIAIPNIIFSNSTSSFSEPLTFPESHLVFRGHILAFEIYPRNTREYKLYCNVKRNLPLSKLMTKQRLQSLNSNLMVTIAIDSLQQKWASSISRQSATKLSLTKTFHTASSQFFLVACFPMGR